MLLDSFIIGTHGWFARDGDAFTTPAPGTVGRESKPDSADAVYQDFGAIESADPTVAQEETKLWQPAPGRLVLRDVMENKQELSYKVKTNELSGLTIEMMYRTSQKLQGAQKQFNPLSAVSRRGWVHFEKYDQNDELWLTLDLYCRIRASGKFDGKPTMPEFDLFVLYSSLLTGQIA